MKFISYAQNFEDVILWRALQDVKNGFYIDIGAQDPIIDSVSNAFYEHGWDGVSIEPNETYAEKFSRSRPREILEQIVIGKASGEVVFYAFPGTGLSTADADVAERHKAAGFDYIEKKTPVFSLEEILNKYGNREIHWLKIDVEGWEKNVLESWGESCVRPWVLVIEGTAPLTQELTHEQWEYIVFSKGYKFAYFDGLNRFYVHEEHLDLLEKLSIPPNVFDGFCLSGTATHSFCQIFFDRINAMEDLNRSMYEQCLKLTESALHKVETLAQNAEVRAQNAEVRAQNAEVRAQEAEDRVHSLSSSLAEANKNLGAARQELHQVHQANNHHWQVAETRQKNLDAVYSSWSWRVTAPMRWGGAMVLRPVATARTFANWVICNGIETFQRPLSKLMAYVLRRPQLSCRINQVLLRYPALHQQLVGVAHRAGVVAAVQPTHSVHTLSTAGFVTPELANLTPRARQIYAELQKAIENKKGTD